jgi:hypothetical protein
LIQSVLDPLENVAVEVYSPSGSPDAKRMRIGTNKPRMSLSRAALVALVHQYAELCRIEQFSTTNGASLLEIQKLMYLLQNAGEPLRLAFKKAQYGPYAENLNYVLQEMEGHYLLGYGDRTEQIMKLSPLEILPDAPNEANRWLSEGNVATLDRIEAVLTLITGFASPYGLELLATVHWVSTQEDPSAASDSDVAVTLVRKWSDRKGRIFTPTHIRKTWDRLFQTGWLNLAEIAAA